MSTPKAHWRNERNRKIRLKIFGAELVHSIEHPKVEIPIINSLNHVNNKKPVCQVA